MRPNSVHGRHFVLVADGRLRASDKIMVRGRGWGGVVGERLPARILWVFDICPLLTSQSALACQFSNMLTQSNTTTGHKLVFTTNFKIKIHMPENIFGQRETRWEICLDSQAKTPG